MSEPTCTFKFDGIWTGRIDSEESSEQESRLHQVISPLGSGPVVSRAGGLALIGFCCDEGVRRNKGRGGARHAPDQLRRALANLPWPAGRPAYDAGNVICEGEQLEQAQQTLASRVCACLSDGHFPVVLGGGHEMAFGSWLGLTRYFEAQVQAQVLTQAPRIGIINFDAHFDMRLDTNGCSSGTPFYQISQQCKQNDYEFRYCCLGVSEVSNTVALFQRADELGVCYRKDTDMVIIKLIDTLNLLEKFIDGCDVLYLTIDLDVLPACIAPGVSAPAARGVGLDVLEPLIESIVRSGKLKLADIAEYNPNFDIDNWTARVAARLFYCIVKPGQEE